MKPQHTFLFLILLGFFSSSQIAFCQVHFEKELEDSMFAIINAQRREHKLPPLLRSQSIAVAARKHSLDMSKRGFFGHINPDGWDVAKRLNNAGIWYVSCAENVAKTFSIINAHKGFMESKGHRDNMLDRSFTHSGIGVYRGSDGFLCITQNYIQAADTINVDSAAKFIEKKLNRKRVYRSRSYLRRQATIDSIATRHSLKMLKSQNPRIAQDFGNIDASASAFHFVTPRLNDIFGDAKMIRCRGIRMGIGIAQGSSHKYGNGLLWITIIIAE